MDAEEKTKKLKINFEGRIGQAINQCIKNCPAHAELAVLDLSL